MVLSIVTNSTCNNEGKCISQMMKFFLHTMLLMLRNNLYARSACFGKQNSAYQLVQ